MTTIDLRESWRVDLSAWAQRTDAVAELWLFGSRAKGTSGSDSDVDIALALMPPRGDHDLGLGIISLFMVVGGLISKESSVGTSA